MGTGNWQDGGYNFGATQDTPIPPGVPNAGQFTFNNVFSGAWVDPATASGYDYKMTSGDLFTDVTLPAGFSGPFTISSGGNVLGTAGSGDTFTFPGSGVSEFQINGINPLVDPTSASDFPVQMHFDNATAGFTITPVPEPSTALCLASGLLAFVMARYSSAQMHMMRPALRSTCEVDAKNRQAWGRSQCSWRNIAAENYKSLDVL